MAATRTAVGMLLLRAQRLTVVVVVCDAAIPALPSARNAVMMRLVCSVDSDLQL